MIEVTQIDLDRALKHLGFDSVADLHYWAKDDGELNRFDALAEQLAEHRIAAEKAVLDRFDEDWLADVIQDSFEMDWTARDGARAIVRALADALETKNEQ